MTDIADIENKTMEYIRGCYFIWLERRDVPLDTSPRTPGEEFIIGHHIRKIKNLKSWFSSNGLSIPNYSEGRYPDAEYVQEIARKLK
ncbi:TPA: hypothetical protein H2W11_005089 [Salmonella enterica]|nr:hypothetical protein [Salmonella enterica]HAK8361160.1 hypothetical protein [Salmonella enterica]HAK8660778.1 hypothetical protein [Salmonella enterica]